MRRPRRPNLAPPLLCSLGLLALGELLPAAEGPSERQRLALLPESELRVSLSCAPGQDEHGAVLDLGLGLELLVARRVSCGIGWPLRAALDPGGAWLLPGDLSLSLGLLLPAGSLRARVAAELGLPTGLEPRAARAGGNPAGSPGDRSLAARGGEGLVSVELSLLKISDPLAFGPRAGISFPAGLPFLPARRGAGRAALLARLGAGLHLALNAECSLSIEGGLAADPGRGRPGEGLGFAGFASFGFSMELGAFGASWSLNPERDSVRAAGALSWRLWGGAR